MPQTNYTPILIYASGTTGNTPAAGNLTNSAGGAELAINYFDGRLFYKDASNVVQVLATKGTATIGGSNTQVQFNSSGSLAGSANLTFDGTTLTANALTLTNRLTIANGGTNATATPTAGAVAYGTGTAYAFTAAGTSNQVLISNGAGAPSWSNLSSLGVTSLSFGTTGLTPSVATQGAITVAGTLGVANGGTGLTSLTANRIPYGAGTSAFANSANLTYDGTTFTSAGASNLATSTGNVGIGTASPTGTGQKVVHIAGTGGGINDYGSISLSNTSGSGANYASSIDSYAQGNLLTSIKTKLSGGGNTGQVEVWTTATGGTLFRHSIFHQYGAFQVGESNGTRPGSISVFNAQSGANLTLLDLVNVQSANNSGVNINLSSISTNGTLYPQASITGYKDTSGVATVTGGLIFSTNNNSASTTERMRITAAGSVGINTNNPSANEKLTVVGDAATGTSAIRIDTVAGASPSTRYGLNVTVGNGAANSTYYGSYYNVTGHSNNWAVFVAAGRTALLQTDISGTTTMYGNALQYSVPASLGGSFAFSSTQASIAAGTGPQLTFYGDTSGQGNATLRAIFAGVYGVKENGSYLDNKGALLFLTNPVVAGDNSQRTTADLQERMRITSDGNALIGTTTNTNSSRLVVNGTISETVSGTQYLVASQYDVGTNSNQIPLNQYLGALAYQDSEWVQPQVGTGITAGTGTICKTSFATEGGVKVMRVLIDLTGLNSGGTANDIIGVNGTANPCYIAQIPSSYTVLGGRMTCLETPAGGDTDIDLYSATEGTGVEDQAITALTETLIINAGAQTAGTVTYFSADPAANTYFYLAGQGTANATYTAGRFLIEVFGA